MKLLIAIILLSVIVIFPNKAFGQNGRYGLSNYQNGRYGLDPPQSTPPTTMNAHVPNNLELGYALLQKGAFEKAISKFDEVLKKNPSNVDALLNSGVALYCLGNFKLAIEQYKTAIEQYQNVKTKNKGYLSTIYFNLGLAYYFLGQDKFNEAEKSYLSAIEQSPNKFYPEAYNNLGILYHYHNKLEEARHFYEKAIEQKLNYPLAHYNLSGLLNELSEGEKAIEEIKIAIKQNPESAEAHLNLGNLYLNDAQRFDIKELDKPIKEYKKALELKGGFYPFAHENLAITLSLSKKFDEALQEYRLAINQYSTTPSFTIPERTMRNLLSSINKEQTSVDEEQPSINEEQIFDIANEFNHIDDKIKTKIKSKPTASNFDEIFESYERLDEEFKNNPNIKYCFGIAYIQSGKLEQACKLLNIHFYSSY